MYRGRCGGCGRCELPAILRVTPESLAASDLFAAGEAKKSPAISVKHCQVSDLDVTDLGFSVPRITLCATGVGMRHAFFSITFLSIQAVSQCLWADTALSRGPESRAPKTPNHPQRKPPFGTCYLILQRNGCEPACGHRGHCAFAMRFLCRCRPLDVPYIVPK